jgi:peptidoglycan hydrolase CwlO-like protein
MKINTIQIFRAPYIVFEDDAKSSYSFSALSLSVGIRQINDELKRLEKKAASWEKDCKEINTAKNAVVCENEKLEKRVKELETKFEIYKDAESQLFKAGNAIPMIEYQKAHYVDSYYFTGLFAVNLKLEAKLAEYKKENDRLCIELDETHDSLWNSREAEGYANSEITSLKAKIKSLEYDKDKLQNELKGITFNSMRIDEANEVPKETLDDMWMIYASTLCLKSVELKAIKIALEKGEIPKFKIQVTPEQSEYVQKWIMANKGTWYSGNKKIKNTKQRYLFTRYDNRDVLTHCSNYKATFNDDNSPEITFDQFKAWAKPIEPEIKTSDFPLLAVVEKDGEKYIGFMNQTPGTTTNRTKVYHWDTKGTLCTTYFHLYEVHCTGGGQLDKYIKVTKTMIKELKVGDSFYFSDGYSYVNSTDIDDYYHVNKISLDENRIYCEDQTGHTTKFCFILAENPVYKFELK